MIRYVLQSSRGHFLSQIDDGEVTSLYVTDPNEAFLWAHPEAAKAKEKTLNRLGGFGGLKAVEVIFVLNDKGSYDYFVDDTQIISHGSY